MLQFLNSRLLDHRLGHLAENTAVLAGFVESFCDRDLETPIAFTVERAESLAEMICWSDGGENPEVGLNHQ